MRPLRSRGQNWSSLSFFYYLLFAQVCLLKIIKACNSLDLHPPHTQTTSCLCDVILAKTQQQKKINVCRSHHVTIFDPKGFLPSPVSLTFRSV